MRAVSAVALLGIALFGAGMSGVTRVDQQVAQADVAAQRAADRAAQTRTVDCPWHERRDADRRDL